MSMRPGELVVDDRPRDDSHTLAPAGELDPVQRLFELTGLTGKLSFHRRPE